MKRRKNKNKSKSIAQIKINGNTYSIRATVHAQQRMKERDIDSHQASGSVLSLGEKKILDLQKREAEAIIIDKDKGTAIVIGFKGNKVQIITAINKSDVFVKEGTVVEEL